jgi:hypothetical protein
MSFSLIVASHADMGHCGALSASDKTGIVDVERVAALRTRLGDLLASSEEAQWLDDGDFTLHRFLVSRGDDLDKAEAMFRGTVAWRSAHDVRGELVRWRAMPPLCGAGPSEEPNGGEPSGEGERSLALKYGYAARAGCTDDGVPLNVERREKAEC